MTSSFTYAPTTHNLNTVTSAGVTTTNTYNSAGLLTQSVSTGGGQKQKTSAAYDSYGQKTSSTDVNNTTTSYDRSYYTGHHISGITEGSLKQQRFTYLTNERLSITSMSGLAAQHYGYANGNLSTLSRKSRVGTGAFTWQSYHFAYDPFGNMTQISVSGADNNATSTPSSAIMLAKYQYESGVNNGRLQKMTFGNDQTVQYSYDKFDRTTKEQYNNITYEYAYDASGQLAKQTSTAGEEYNYEYDSLGRLIRSNEYNDGTFEQRTEHIYDASNRLTKQSWYNVGGTTTMSYAYSTTTGLLSSLNATVQNSSIPVTYTYQGANQLRSKAIGSVMTKAYNFGTSSGYRTALPNFVNYRDPDGNLIYGDYCVYDGNGRIVSIADSGNTSSVRATYGYDEQGQLTSAAVGGTRYAYTYDTAGNLITKTDGGTSHSYTYGNGAWRDLLTAYDGKSITYSGGNPTKYYNGSTFTWTQGRKLATAKVGNTNISYTYDMAGVRSSKTVGSTTYKYTTLSGLVTRQTGGNATIDFVYDESNQPLAMKYNGKVYYYVLNAQGDVVRIVDGSRNVVASYSYDPWGKLLSSSGTLANVNPLRYRGYYYDSETGFYYLQSRYYDPAIGRFINADSYASTDATGLLSTNMFAYCENDPVNKSDPTGEVAPILVAMAGGALVGIAEQFMTDVIYAMVTGQSLDACFSSVGTYVSSAVGGAMSVLPGGGVMRAFSELVLTTTIQTSIDAALAPQKYEKTTPYSEAIENVFTTGASKLGDKTASNVADKMFKSAAKQGKVGSKVTKAAAGALKSIKKYFGNAFNILLRIRDDMRQDKRGR